MNKPHILIVEDDGIIANRIMDTLTDAGYTADIADTGEKAIRMAQDIQPDILLMDIRLKGDMDGIETAARINRHAEIPFLYLTAHSDDELIQRAKQTKPLGYLVKPFRARELLASLEIGLHRHRLDKQQRELEARLQYLQKMKSLGTMSGAVAHNFNNIAQIILGCAEMILEESIPESSIPRYVNEIFNACKRVENITTQFLLITGNAPTKQKPLKLSEPIREIAPILELGLPKGCAIHYQLPPDADSICADGGQVKQVLVYLVTNALEAIAHESGLISVSTGVTEADQAYLTREFPNQDLPAGRFVFLEVADNGSGMEESIKNSIFEPFFTTKMFGRGLGLPAVQGIVKTHRGGISVTSRPQAGTTVRILFPAMVAKQPGN